MISDKISILITGGTFDKEYDEINGILSFKKTQIHEILHQSRAKIEFKIKDELIDLLVLKNNTNKDFIIVDAAGMWEILPRNQIWKI